jgi:osmotically-inducible protein OsmY
MTESRRVFGAQPVKTATSAERITAALRADPRLNVQSMPVRVESDGDRVRLAGWVPDLSDRVRIGGAAIAVGGATNIENDLLVGPPNQRPDDDIANAVRAILTEDQAIDETSIQVSVQNGVVKLDGLVDTSNHRRYAAALCWWIPGVRGVENALTSIDVDPESDELLAGTIEELLEKDPLVDRTEILILSHDGRITLSGTVAGEDARAAAESDAWSVEGVRDVTNDIEVASSTVIPAIRNFDG